MIFSIKCSPLPPTFGLHFVDSPLNILFWWRLQHFLRPECTLKVTLFMTHTDHRPRQWRSSKLVVVEQGSITQPFRKPCGPDGGLLLGYEDAGRVVSLGQSTCPAWKQQQHLSSVFVMGRVVVRILQSFSTDRCRNPYTLELLVVSIYHGLWILKVKHSSSEAPAFTDKFEVAQSYCTWQNLQNYWKASQWCQSNL